MNWTSGTDVSSLARFVKGEDDRTTGEILLGGGVVVPAALFGNFFEHMAAATAGGVLAELLVNPTFSRRHFLTREQLDILLSNGRVIAQFARTHDPHQVARDWHATVNFTGFGAAIFDDETLAGVPLPWAATGNGNVSPAVGRVGHAVRLAGGSAWGEEEGLGGDLAGIRQVVFPPAHRVSSLRVAGMARVTSRGSGVLLVEVRHGEPTGGTTLGEASVTVSGGAWQPFECELSLDGANVGRAQPVDFILRWLAEEGIDVLLDRVSVTPSDAVGIFDPEALATAAGVTPELRWPGGNFASYYHWRDGVGPAADRPTLENQAWGGLEYNILGTDEYVQMCRLLGAEPHITVNAGTGSAEEAAAWVEYCNGSPESPMGALRAANGNPEPYDVSIWEIGNELWGEFQGGNVGGELNARRFGEFATKMRAASPIPLRVLATGNWFDLVDVDDPRLHYASVDGVWQSELLTQAADEVDAVSMHWIPFASGFVPEDPSADEDANRALLAQLVTAERRQIPQLMDEFDRSGRDSSLPPIEIALTEWNPVGSAVNERARRLLPYNFGSVVWGAACLNTLIRASGRITAASPNGWFHGGSVHKTAGVLYADPTIELKNKYLELFSGGVVCPVLTTGPAFDAEWHADLGTPEYCIPCIDVLAVETSRGIALSVLNRDGTAAHSLHISLPAGSPRRFVTWSHGHQDVAQQRTFADPRAFPPLQRSISTEDGALTMDLLPHVVVLLWPAGG